MVEAIVKRSNRTFLLTRDLATVLPEHALQFKLGDLPSNTIGEQFWCMVGARESYLKAMRNAGWAGFSCSLTDTASKEMVMSCLDDSSARCLAFLAGGSLSEVQLGFILDLLEHEVQHHGQLIRYMYANRLAFPQSWTERYTV